MATKYEYIEKAYKFLVERAKSGKGFSVAEFAGATGWTESTVKTNLSKKLKDVVEPHGKLHRARREFVGVTEEQFRDLLSQTRHVFSSYARRAYSHVVTFEFLLPLTQQTRLREALDALFFRDQVEKRLAEIDLRRLEKFVPRDAKQTGEVYRDSVIAEINRLFGGYSIGQVSGRFRTHDLMPKSEAWRRDRYVVDEETAVVRFIVPCSSTRIDVKDGDDAADIVAKAAQKNEDNAKVEAGRIRGLFFEFFVEAIVKRIHNEDEIWLLENGVESRLYVWSRS